MALLRTVGRAQGELDPARHNCSDRSISDYPARSTAKARARHVWDRYIGWGIREDLKRRAMAQLAVSHRIFPAAIGGAREPLAVLEDMLADSMGLAIGLDTPRVAATMTALANVAMDFVIRDPVASARQSISVSSRSGGLSRKDKDVHPLNE